MGKATRGRSRRHTRCEGVRRTAKSVQEDITMAARVYRRNVGLVALIAAMGANGCVLESGETESAEDLGEASDELYVEAENLFDRPIRVCWNFDGWDTEKEWVRSAVEETWMRETNVEFHDWSRCPAWDALDDYDYMIDVHEHTGGDDRPHTNGIGRDGSVMDLEFSFARWMTGCRASEAAREGCIRNIAVHEFGHAMGFAHEQNRVDGPACDAPDDGSGNWALGEYDVESVMLYTGTGPGCQSLAGNGGQLSPGDIRAARQLYGAKASGSIVGFGGNCLDVAGGANHNGADVQMFDCNGSGAQRWGYDQASGALLQGGGRVLDIYQANSNPGTPVTLWDWWGGENQRYQFTDLEIRHLGKCLSRGNEANFTQLTLQRCNGNANQKWELTRNGEIRRPMPVDCYFFCPEQKCMDVAYGGTANFTSVGTYTCHGGQPQKWKIMPGGSIIAFNGGSNKCLDVQFGRTTNGTPIGIYDCHGGESQKFSFRGRIKPWSGSNASFSQKCLDVWGFGRTNHSDVVSWDCHGGRNQIWELVP
jgi:hypothetical protein